MSEKHIQGRMVARAWTSHAKTTIGFEESDGNFMAIADVGDFGRLSEHDEQDARRLVACWNACEGISTDALEKLYIGEESLPHTIGVLRSQRDELLAALEDAVSVCRSVSISHDRRIVRDGCTLYAQTEEWCKWVEDEIGPKLIAAIAKVKGGAA